MYRVQLYGIPIEKLYVEIFSDMKQNKTKILPVMFLSHCRTTNKTYTHQHHYLTLETQASYHIYYSLYFSESKYLSVRNIHAMHAFTDIHKTFTLISWN